ncbi:phosphonate C-P lyase system protein PhnG [Polycladidibacter hongkongensis]|uniref:phosphonate C-P lyase system protein PhnG n=1 Tax=Polycladidibacter hongkongensis TaxID=1647556 RepID=UPI00082A3F97|nr:phosphonate C-P lyase system protein PhnG [Pseudovibrio hongkongensis]
MTSSQGTSPRGAPSTGEPSARRTAMATLANATIADLEARLAAHPLPQEHTIIRQPEIGLVMVRGRAGGTGAPFNLCEATVTRCVVALPDGTTGFGQCLGRDKHKALLCAALDAYWQQEPLQEAIESEILAPLRNIETKRKEQTKAEVAATKVDFFTMVRGE